MEWGSTKTLSRSRDSSKAPSSSGISVISWVEPWTGTKYSGSTLVQNTAQLKAELSKAFPTVQNKKELETRFYASQQRQNQEPTDFVYDLLRLHKKLELGMSEKALSDHIFVRLEPQVQNYIEVRNPQTAIQLLEVLAKFEERYSFKATLGSRNSNNVEGRGWNERRMSNVANNRGNWRNSEVVHRSNNGRNDYRDSNQNNRQGNQWFESRNRFQNDDRRFKDRGYQFRNRGQNDDFSRGEQRNRGSSENFSLGSRKQMGRLNVLKVNDIKGDQTQSINQPPIKLSAICMSPVELPYVPILLDETFTKALWDTGVEKSFISEETYPKYFFYKQVKESSTQVDQRSFCSAKFPEGTIDGNTTYLHLYNFAMGLEGREKFSSPLHSYNSVHNTFGPIVLMSTYSVCTRRVFGGIGHRTQAFQSGVRGSNH
ncbi:uncharacterized protein TNCV_2868411 [Trichonephila clavipes]|nr:uncharacterized protein TNCV_2868411 [Trichonephila clavipes]